MAADIQKELVEYRPLPVDDSFFSGGVTILATGVAAAAAVVVVVVGVSSSNFLNSSFFLFCAFAHRSMSFAIYRNHFTKLTSQMFVGGKQL